MQEIKFPKKSRCQPDHSRLMEALVNVPYLPSGHFSIYAAGIPNFDRYASHAEKQKARLEMKYVNQCLDHRVVPFSKDVVDINGDGTEDIRRIEGSITPGCSAQKEKVFQTYLAGGRIHCIFVNFERTKKAHAKLKRRLEDRHLHGYSIRDMYLNFRDREGRHEDRENFIQFSLDEKSMELKPKWGGHSYNFRAAFVNSLNNWYDSLRKK